MTDTNHVISCDTRGNQAVSYYVELNRKVIRLRQTHINGECLNDFLVVVGYDEVTSGLVTDDYCVILIRTDSYLVFAYSFNTEGLSSWSVDATIVVQ